MLDSISFSWMNLINIQVKQILYDSEFNGIHPKETHASSQFSTEAV